MIEIDVCPVQTTILMLLKCDSSKGQQTSIPGMSYLIREIFLIKTTSYGNELLCNLSPYTVQDITMETAVFSAVNDLKATELIELKEKNDQTLIKLTEKGSEWADRLLDCVDNDLLSVIKYVKSHFNHPLPDIIADKIPSIHPETA